MTRHLNKHLRMRHFIVSRNSMRVATLFLRAVNYAFRFGRPQLTFWLASLNRL